MATVSGTFTEVGASASLYVREGDRYTLSVTGTFVQTIHLEYSDNAGATWRTLVEIYSAGLTAQTRIADATGHYRFRCVADTSGTSTYSVADAVQTLQEFITPDGTKVASVDEDGFDIPILKHAVASPTRSGAGSYQVLEIDLNLDAGVGSSDGADPDFIAAGMFNVLGADLTAAKDSNYIGAVIAHYNVTGTKATNYPSGSVLAGIGDGVTEVDGAVVAYIDGDSAQTNAVAAFKAMSQNSTAGSGFDYGLDLFGAAHDGYNELAILNAAIRMDKEVCVLQGAGAPTDGGAGTGAGFAEISSQYHDRTNGNTYVNAGTKASPTWKLVMRSGRTAQKRIVNVNAKVGGTAGWTVGAADDLGLLATLAASQTASTLVVPIPGLKVGDTITAFHLIGQIESAGNTATLDADLRKLTAAAADVTDASVGAITQISVIADTKVDSANSEKNSLAEVVAEDETFYVLLTGTTAALTDIALQGIAITVTEA